VFNAKGLTRGERNGLATGIQSSIAVSDVAGKAGSRAGYLRRMAEKKTMDELGRISPDDYHRAQKRPMIVVLDNIRSGLNVGSIFRSADAFRVQEVICCGITPCPPHREILKTSLGATESVPWRYVGQIADALSEIRSRNIRIWSVEQAHGSIPVTVFVPDGPIALVFGNEVSGVSQEALDVSDGVVEIIQDGSKHSLNVAVTAGIALHEVSRHFSL